MKMSEPFADLKYDQYRAIRFRDEKRFFADADRGFRMDLMPPGLSFQDRIEINLVANGVAEPIAFSTDYFAFHPDFFPYRNGQAPSRLAADMGFSGIRLRHPINSPGVWDDFAVFQGASYFRAVARDTLYGLSARGLAVGTGGPDAGGVPDLHRLLDPRAAARRPRPPPQRAPRQRQRHRRLRLRHPARHPHAHDRPLGALPPPRDQDASASRP